MEGLSIADAMSAAGIDYEVKAVPAHAALPTDDGSWSIQAIRDAQHTYRVDTNEVLAQVGPRYHVVQTKEVTTLIEEMVGGGWSPLFAGPTNKSRAVFMVGKLPFESEHGIDPYLAFVNSFDGSTGIRLANTPVRAMCTNAIRRTFKHAKASFSLRHTTNISARVDDARIALNLATAYYRRLDADIARLLRVGIDEKRVEEAVNALFPVDAPDLTDRQRTNREAQQAEVISNLNYSPTIPDAYRSTAWGLWNAMSEIEQWAVEPTDKNRDMLLGAQLGVSTATLKADKMMLVIDSWSRDQVAV